MNPRRRLRLRQQKKHLVVRGVETATGPVFRYFRLALWKIRRQDVSGAQFEDASELFAGFE